MTHVAGTILLALLLILQQIHCNMNACIERILNNQQCENIVHIYDPGYGLTEILQTKSAKTYVVLPGIPIENFDSPVDLILICTNNLYTFYKMGFTFPMQVPILIIYYGSKGDLQAIFSHFWEYSLLNVMVVIENLEVFVNRPVTAKKCLGSTPRSTGHCSRIGFIRKTSEVYNLENCSLLAFALYKRPFVDSHDFLDNSGLEVSIFRIIAEKLKSNISFIVVESSDDVGESFELSSTIFFGGVPYTIDYYYDYIYYPLQDTESLFVVMVKLDSWKNILFIFDKLTWLGLMVSTVLVGFVYYFLDNRTNITDSFLLTITILISYLPNIPSKHKLFVAIWCCAAFIFTSAFQALLISTIYKPDIKPAVSTWDELVEKKWKIGVPSVFADFICNEENWGDAYRHICNNIEVCTADGLHCASKLKEGRFAQIGYERSLNYHLNKTTLYNLNEYFTSYLSFATSKMSFYRAAFKKYLILVAEGGLLQKLEKEFPKPMEFFAPSFQPIAFHHVSLTLSFYCGGILLSMLALLIEVAYVKLINP